MNPMLESLESRPDAGALQDFLNRRVFLRNGGSALGAAALASLLGRPDDARGAASNGTGLPGFPNHPARAKRVIYLFMSGGPSQSR